MNRRAVFGFALAASLGACQEKPDNATPALSAAPLPAPVTAAPAPTPAPLATVAAPVTTGPLAELPTPEDFEQQALDEINPQNLEQELDKLEKEIGR